MGDMVEGAFFRDVMGQPQALATTVAAFQSEPRRDLTALGQLLRGGQFRRVVLTGMGASLHSLHPLFLQLATARTTPVLIETSELIHHTAELLDGGSLVVAVSQSGRSAEIVRFTELAEGRATVVAITNDPASPLATRTAHTILTRAGDEANVSTKTYVSTLAALGWLGAHLTGGDPRAAAGAYAEVPALLERYLQVLPEHVRALQQELSGVQHPFVLGRGPSLAAAFMGGLMLKEAARVHGEAMSSACFRHGPFEMIGQSAYCFVLSGYEPSAPLNAKLVADVKSAGGRAALVAGPGASGPFAVPQAADPVRPLLEILPLQAAALAFAALAGHEAGVFEHASKVVATE